MVNKDYILRIAERLGRELSIILGLRKRRRDEEALIYIDEILLKTTGMTSRFLNSLSDEMLIKAISPLGILNVETCLGIATLLKAEGEIYAERNNARESYYRFLKALSLFLEALEHEPIDTDALFQNDITELLATLADYELPASIQRPLLRYYERQGQYAHVEDLLFELLESTPTDHALISYGQDFYTRLLTKSTADLQAGNFSREEAQEGLSHLRDRA